MHRGTNITQLIVIGTVAGLFSGLFGVGGGTVLVPLLTLWLGYDTKLAAGTSLAAIGVIAFGGVIIHVFYGNVHFLSGLLVGVPAVGGVVVGTYLQQRLPTRALSLLFAGLLVAIATDLVLG